MITAHQYKLPPNKQQASQFDDWLSLLRMQYNWRRAERFNWFEFNRSPVNSCSLVSCSIAPIVKQPDYYWQKKDLLNTKKLFPKTIANRWHSCHLCGWEVDRDVNAAINVKNIAVRRTVIEAILCVSYVDAGLAQKSTLYSSTS